MTLPQVKPMHVVELEWCKSVEVTRVTIIRRTHSRLVRDEQGGVIGRVLCRPEQDPR